MITLQNSKHSPRNLKVLDLQELGQGIQAHESLYLIHHDRHLLARNMRALVLRACPGIGCEIIRLGNPGRPGSSLDLEKAMDGGNGTFVALGQAEFGVLAGLARIRPTLVCGLLADGPVSPGVLGMVEKCTATGLVVLDPALPSSFQRSGTGMEFFACLGECLVIMAMDDDVDDEGFSPALEALGALAGAFGPGLEDAPDPVPGLAELGLRAAWFHAGGENRGLEEFRRLCDALGRALDRDAAYLAGVVLPGWLSICVPATAQERLARIMTRIWGLEWGEDLVRIDEGAGRLSLLAGSLELPNRARDLRIISADVWEGAVNAACQDARLAERLKAAW